MTLPPVLDLGLFILAVLSLAMFGLAASGQFPREHRAAALQSAAGSAVLWGSIAIALLSTIVLLLGAFMRLPWYAAVIGGGLSLLLAPLVLRKIPDWLVDGPVVLVVLAAAAVLAVALRI